MNLKISVDRPTSQHRAPRKPITREARAYASAATLPRAVVPTAFGPTVAPLCAGETTASRGRSNRYPATSR